MCDMKMGQPGLRLFGTQLDKTGPAKNAQDRRLRPSHVSVLWGGKARWHVHIEPMTASFPSASVGMDSLQPLSHSATRASGLERLEPPRGARGARALLLRDDENNSDYGLWSCVLSRNLAEEMPVCV
jgi:hypothetical protein